MGRNCERHTPSPCTDSSPATSGYSPHRPGPPCPRSLCCHFTSFAAASVQASSHRSGWSRLLPSTLGPLPGRLPRQPHLVRLSGMGHDWALSEPLSSLRPHSTTQSPSPSQSVGVPRWVLAISSLPSSLGVNVFQHHLHRSSQTCPLNCIRTSAAHMTSPSGHPTGM